MLVPVFLYTTSIHNEHDGVANHLRIDCLLDRLFRCRSKEISKLHVTGLCDWNPLTTSGFPSQSASNAEIVSIWWRHYVNIVAFGRNLKDVIRKGWYLTFVHFNIHIVLPFIGWWIAGYCFAETNTLRQRQNGRNFADDSLDTFPRMIILEFRIRFQWTLFRWVQLKYASIGSDNGLEPTRRQAIIWTNDGLVYWRKYASLGLRELTHC